MTPSIFLVQQQNHHYHLQNHTQINHSHQLNIQPPNYQSMLVKFQIVALFLSKNCTTSCLLIALQPQIFHLSHSPPFFLSSSTSYLTLPPPSQHQGYAQNPYMFIQNFKNAQFPLENPIHSASLLQIFSADSYSTHFVCFKMPVRGFDNCDLHNIWKPLSYFYEDRILGQVHPPSHYQLQSYVHLNKMLPLIMMSQFLSFLLSPFRSCHKNKSNGLHPLSTTKVCSKDWMPMTSHFLYENL